MTKKRKKIIVYPFGIPTEDYIQMFEKDIPDKLSIAVVLVPTTDIPESLKDEVFEGIDNYLLPLFEKPLSNPFWFLPSERSFPGEFILYENIENNPEMEETRNNIRAVIKEYPELAADTGPSYSSLDISWIEASTYNSENNMPATLKTWIYNGIYVQVGFFTEDLLENRNIAGCITAAMTGYDELVDKYGSVEAKDHKPIEIITEDEISVDPELIDFYHSGCGVWSKKLINLRNRWLIGLRAFLMGKEPMTEFDKFLRANGKYFLEYPELCK